MNVIKINQLDSISECYVHPYGTISNLTCESNCRFCVRYAVSQGSKNS